MTGTFDKFKGWQWEVHLHHIYLMDGFANTIQKLRRIPSFFHGYKVHGNILRDIKKDAITEKLKEINIIHPSLKFTYEEESENSIAFLSMKLTRSKSY